MLRLVTTSRRALLLYGALLVLPTLVLGVLYWSELQRDYARERQAIPEKARAAARRIGTGMSERLLRLLDGETQRSFTQYADVIAPEDAVGDDLLLQRTPLEKELMPIGILGWFSYERAVREESPIRVFVGQGVPDRERWRETLRGAVQDFRRKDFEKRLLDRMEVGPNVDVPLCELAVSQTTDPGLDCVKACMPELRGRSVRINVSDFRLHFFRDQDRRPLALASRRVKGLYSPRDLPANAPCLAALDAGISLQQGFVIDLQWLLKDLPWDIAKTVLDEDEDEELRVPPEALPMDQGLSSQVYEEILPLVELGFETEFPEDRSHGRLEVVIDTERFEDRIARQSQSFLVTGGMLLLTLGIGMTLLYTSVRRELDQAHRMQNFVAAVTHELRTPISTIRLHAEMLQDGWVAAEKQPEYYDRIVRETQRLGTLVERVLEKSRLKENVTRPVAGDLNSAIEGQKEDLLAAAGDHPDVAFQLEPGLPKVWLTAEGLSMILSNLVENARKYAPPGKEPLLVRTRWSDGRVLLEVLDRGPGVPESEREKIFEAFYRIGREETRTTTGTGLGLHLVRLHAETCGAKASVDAREGGGSVFRVAFRPAE